MIGLIIILGVVSGLMLMVYEDGVPFALAKKIRCRMGYHKIHEKVGRAKVHKYYCQFCKTPRSHPVLKVVDGGNKIRNNNYKF